MRKRSFFSPPTFTKKKKKKDFYGVTLVTVK